MKILVTGGAGFIGQYVVEECIARGHEPFILDHYDRKENYPCPVVLGDVRDDVAVTEAMAHADAWIHLAAVLGTQETVFNPRPAAQSNLMGGLNMLEAAAQYNLPGTYIGVGNHWMNNTYSITKTMIERFIDMYNSNRGTRVNIVRAMNAYGPRQRPVAPWGCSKVRKIAPSFICRALSNMDVEVYGDGLQVSDMCWVGDVAKALVIATEKAAKGTVFPEAVEVGPEINSTVKEVAELVVKFAGTDSKIVNLPMRPGELAGSKVKADVSTLRYVDMQVSDLMPLEDGMRQTVEWFKENYFSKK
jgi:nucleoside-diphosphate-sugar epimerase